VERLSTCLTVALPLIQKGAAISKFVAFFASHVIPVFHEINESKGLVLLRLIAEISPYCSPLDAKSSLPNFYAYLQHYMPLKSSSEAETEAPKIYFSEIECLLYIFHHLASKAPTVLHPVCGVIMHTGQPSEMIGSDFSDKLADFRARLTYCEEYTNNYIRSLNQATEKLKTNFQTEADPEAKKIILNKLDTVLTALKTNKNIKELVQALNKKVPTFLSKGASLVLSWRQPKTEIPATNTGSQKRPVDPNAASSSGPQVKRTRGSAQPLYVPPGRAAALAASDNSTGSSSRGGVTRGRGRGNKSWRGGANQ